MVTDNKIEKMVKAIDMMIADEGGDWQRVITRWPRPVKAINQYGVQLRLLYRLGILESNQGAIGEFDRLSSGDRGCVFRTRSERLTI